MLKVALIAAALLGSTALAMAADLPMSAAVPVATGTDWTGFYAGFNVGYGPGTALSTDDDFTNDNGEVDFSGGFVGGQIGYDFDLNNGFVVGVEGDIEKTWETGSITDGTDFTKDTLNWTAALTGHAGYKLSDTFLPYVLAGIAFANNTIEDAFTREGSFDGISTNTHVGYTVGAGLQAALTQSISGFVEGRYSDYGIKLYGAESANDNSAQDGPVALSDWTVRAGFNFKFH